MPNRLCLWLVATLLASAASAAQPRAPRIDITCDQKDPVKREACVANVREADIPVEDRILVQFKPGSEPRPRVAFGERKAEEFSALTGVRMRLLGLSGHDDVILFELRRYATLKQLEDLLAKLRADPDVISARGSGPPFYAPYPPEPGEETMQTACPQDDPIERRGCEITWMYEHVENVNEIIIQFRPGVEPRPRALVGRRMARELSSLAGIRLTPNRLSHGNDWQIFRIPEYRTEQMVHGICEKLRQHPDVIHADPNGHVYPNAAPNDPFYQSAQQWALGNVPGAAAVAAAWDLSTGSASTVVAILDTGLIRRQVNGQWQYHEDLQARTILPGYDFISDPGCAGDGNGRDADFSDPGDAPTGGRSSWHGTQIAGIVAATTNNRVGVAGIDWSTRILPVRTLGKCGGTVNDVAAAVLWASGSDVPGVPANGFTARVVNMSLSGPGQCPPEVQAAIDEAVARGSVVVASAGNDRVSGSFYPATCKGVISVVATDRAGKRWSDSNWGAGTTVSAPGVGIISTGDFGTQSPLYDNQYLSGTGTSQAAAIVSGVVSLMLAANPNLKPSEVDTILRATATQFPRTSGVVLGACAIGDCGAGIVNAAAAVNRALAGPASRGQTLGLAVLRNNTVAAWGDNYCGELGRPPFQLNQPAIQVPGLADVVDVFAGFRAAFARKRDGTMWAWGCAKYRVPDDNLLALLGDPTLPFAEGDGTATPVAIPALDAAVQIAVSSYLLGDDLDPMFMAAVTPQGQVLTWGSNYYGQLGTGSLTPSFRAAPAVVPGLADIKDIQLGWAHAVALRRDGTVWSWGVNEYGQLGRGSIGSDSAAPAQVAGLSGVTRIAAGNLASFALLGDGSVWAWGYRAAGDGRDLGSPTRVAIGSATGISASEESGIAVLSDGSVVTWGSRGGPRPVSGLLPDPIQLTSDKSSVIGYGDGRLGVLGPNGQGFLNVASPSGLTQADLRAGLTAPASPIALGSTVTLQASITNAGPDIAPASQLTVEIAENFTLASVPVGCSTVGTTLTCSAGDLASGATQTYQVAVKASGVGSAATLAGARSAVYDVDPSNDAVLVATDVTQGASVQVDVPALPLWGLIASAALMVGTAWRRIPPSRIPSRFVGDRAVNVSLS